MSYTLPIVSTQSMVFHRTCLRFIRCMETHVFEGCGVTRIALRALVRRTYACTRAHARACACVPQVKKLLRVAAVTKHIGLATGTMAKANAGMGKPLPESLEVHAQRWVNIGECHSERRRRRLAPCSPALARVCTYVCVVHSVRALVCEGAKM